MLNSQVQTSSLLCFIYGICASHKGWASNHFWGALVCDFIPFLLLHIIVCLFMYAFVSACICGELWKSLSLEVEVVLNGRYMQWYSGLVIYNCVIMI